MSIFNRRISPFSVMVVSAMTILLACSAPAEEDKKPDINEALTKALEASAQAKDAAAQAKESAAQIKELTEKLEKAIQQANEATAQAKEAIAVLHKREAAEREKEARAEAIRKAKEAEIKEAAAEEEAERKQHSETVTSLYEGKLTLYGPEKERASPDIIGEFEHANKKYIVKVGTLEVFKDLVPLDGKQATVNAKVRNKGKYLIVMSVPAPGAAPTYTRRRGGI